MTKKEKSEKKRKIPLNTEKSTFSRGGSLKIDILNDA